VVQKIIFMNRSLIHLQKWFLHKLSQFNQRLIEQDHRFIPIIVFYWTESMARHWGYLTEKPEILATPPPSTATVTVVEKIPGQVVKSVEKEIPHWLKPDSFIENHLIHPIFGEKIKDLGYKTVYLTSIASLIPAQVWERQRILRPDRAARIAASKIQTGRAATLSGVITMYLDKKTGKAGIVDGQHRVGALMLLEQQGHWDRLKRNIIIDVFNTDTDEDVAALFKEINSAEPVRLVDMPGEVCRMNL
jgi:hypothetical protein